MDIIKKLIWPVLILLNISAFSQKDTLDYSISTWTLDRFHSKIETCVDTALENFHIYNPIYKADHVQAFNGNTGQAHQSLNFINREKKSFLFFNPYAAYLFTPENNSFFNTKQAYSQVHYYTNLNKKNNLQNLDVVHNQNILPHLNIGIHYRLIGALGEYKSQKTSNHFFRAFGSYEHKNYNAFLVYNYNKFNSFLNGGLKPETILDDPDNLTDDTKLFPVYLEESKHVMLGRNINLKQSFLLNKTIITDAEDTLKPSISMPYLKIGHELDWNYGKRIYSSDLNLLYYQQFHTDTSVITDGLALDSTGYKKINNTFFVKLIDDTLNKGLPSVTFAYTHSFESFHSFQNDKNYSNHILSVLIDNPIYDKWYWSLSTDYTLMGDKHGDIELNGNLKKYFGKDNQHHLRLKGSFERTTTDYFIQNYSSTFYKWENSNMNKPAVSSIDFAYHNEKLKFEIGIRQSFLDNYIYFASIQDSINKGDTMMVFENIAGYPFQETNTFDLTTAYITHRLDWGPMHMKNSLIYQKSSNDSVLHLPKFTIYNSTYFQMRFFKKVLTLQVGFDFRYNTGYYADGFNPATGLFYNQYEKELGDYPYFDFFINVKLKRARMFFKYEHINQGLNGNQYYTVIDHPMNPRLFRFGLSWRFWN